jgi:hypothetical protein
MISENKIIQKTSEFKCLEGHGNRTAILQQSKWHYEENIQQIKIPKQKKTEHLIKSYYELWYVSEARSPWLLGRCSR